MEQTVNDIPASVLARHNSQPVTEPVDAPTTDAPEKEHLLQRSTRRAGQELLSTVAVPSAIYGMGAAAIDHFKNDVPWEDSMLSKEGRDLVDKASKGDQRSQVRLRHDSSQVLRPGIRAMANIYHGAGEMTGVTNNPDGSVPLDEEVGGIIGSTLLTLPAALVTKPLQAANIVANRAARTAVKAGIHGAEMMLPGTIGTLGGSKAANIGANAVVQVAMNEVARDLMGEENITGMDLMGADVDEALLGYPVDNEDGEVAETAAGIGAAAAVVLGGGRVASKIGRKAASESSIASPPNTDVTTGRMIARNKDDVFQDVNSAGMDANNNLIEGMRRTGLKQEKIDAFEEDMTATVGPATNTAHNKFVTTGILSGDGTVKVSVPWDNMKQMFSKQTPEVQEQVQTYIEAVAELRRRKNGVQNTTQTPAELAALRDANKTPEVEAFADHYFNIGKAINDEQLRTKVITKAQHKKQAAGDYMPVTPKSTARTGLWGMYDKATRQSRDGPTSTVPELGMQATGGVPNMVRPMEAMDQHIPNQLRAIGNNTISRTWLKAMAGREMTETKGKRIRLVSKTPDKGARPVSFMEDGKKKTYYVGDPRHEKVLRFAPAVVAGYGLNTQRRWFQQTTTGDLNPLFAPISLAYDAFAGTLGGRSGRHVNGLLDQYITQIAQKNGLSPAMTKGIRDLAAMARPIDTIGVVGQGAWDGMVGRLKQATALHMIKRSAATGKTMHKEAAENATKVFIETRYGAMQMQGYSANMMSEGVTEIDPGITGSMAAMLKQSVPGKTWKVYTQALDVVRDAYRMGIYSRNDSYLRWKNDKAGSSPTMSATQQKEVVKYVRDISVDPTKRGASDFVNKTLSAMPYGNITLHSTAHLIRNAYTNPAAYATMTSLGLFAYAMKEWMTDEAKEYYETRTPHYRRNTSLAISTHDGSEPFDPDKHMFYFPLGPEVGLIVNGLGGGLQGMIEGEARETGDPTLYETLKQAALDMVIPGVPPIINAAANAAGFGAVDSGAIQRGDGIFRQPKMEGNMPEHRGIGQNDGWVTDRIAGMMESVWGGFGRTVMDAAEIIDQEMAQPDPEYAKGMRNALDVVVFDRFQGGQRVGTLWSDVVRTHPRGTPMGQKAYALDSFTDDVTEFARALLPTYSSGLDDADIPLPDAIAKMPEQISDPVLQGQAYAVKMFFSSKVNSEAMQSVGQLNKRYFRTDSNTDISLSQKNTILNSINDQRHAAFERVLTSYGTFEEQMRRETGNDQWSIDKFADDIRTHIKGQ